MNARKSARLTSLSTADRRARRLLAEEYVGWTLEHRSNVMFTDESRYLFHNVDGRVRIWRRHGDRYLDCTLKERYTFGGGSIMVWASITLKGM